MSEKDNNSQFNKASKNTRCVPRYNVVHFWSIFSVLYVLRISGQPYCVLTIKHGAGRKWTESKYADLYDLSKLGWFFFSANESSTYLFQGPDSLLIDGTLLNCTIQASKISQRIGQISKMFDIYIPILSQGTPNSIPDSSLSLRQFNYLDSHGSLVLIQNYNHFTTFIQYYLLYVDNVELHSLQKQMFIGFRSFIQQLRQEKS